MGFAEAVAGRSLCYRSKTGAVLVASDKRIVSYGYNGPPAGVDTGGSNCSMWCPRGMGLSHRPGYADCKALHGEMNALLHADRGELLGGAAYVTRCPCAACAKSLAGAGIVRVVYGPDPGGTYHRPGEVVELMEAFGVEMEAYGG
jgi:dCMP deaminase